MHWVYFVLALSLGFAIGSLYAAIRLTRPKPVTPSRPKPVTAHASVRSYEPVVLGIEGDLVVLTLANMATEVPLLGSTLTIKSDGSIKMGVATARQMANELRILADTIDESKP